MHRAPDAGVGAAATDIAVHVLDDLLARVVETRERVTARAGDTPVLLKIAPDVTLTELDDGEWSIA